MLFSKKKVTVLHTVLRLLMLGETEEKLGDSHRSYQVPCPDPASEMWARCPVQQGMGQSLKERTTGGSWARKLTNTSIPSVSATRHRCLSEGVVALQDGLTHSYWVTWSYKSRQKWCKCCPEGRGTSNKRC